MTKANENEIVCLCGDHIKLASAGDGKPFVGYCTGCDKFWFLIYVTAKSGGG